MVCLRNPRLSSAAHKLIKSREQGEGVGGEELEAAKRRVGEDGGRERGTVQSFLPCSPFPSCFGIWDGPTVDRSRLV